MYFGFERLKSEKSRGEVINGGFGLVLDGHNTPVAETLLTWDVNNGIARRYRNRFCDINSDLIFEI